MGGGVQDGTGFKVWVMIVCWVHHHTMMYVDDIAADYGSSSKLEHGCVHGYIMSRRSMTSGLMRQDMLVKIAAFSQLREHDNSSSGDALC